MNPLTPTEYAFLGTCLLFGGLCIYISHLWEIIDQLRHEIGKRKISDERIASLKKAVHK